MIKLSWDAKSRRPVTAERGATLSSSSCFFFHFSISSAVTYPEPQGYPMQNSEGHKTKKLRLFSKQRLRGAIGKSDDK